MLPFSRTTVRIRRGRRVGVAGVSRSLSGPVSRVT